jgi:alkaline phosphatase D
MRDETSGPRAGRAGPRPSRRRFTALALSLGATPAFARSPRRSLAAWRETAERFPEGVASGDPDPTSVILWTRREPKADETSARLRLEVSEDPDFRRVVLDRSVAVTGRTDWTCRVLAGGLRPGAAYWYRFTDEHGEGSRVGRTRTAPAAGHVRPVRFAFVSCQNINIGYLTAWRRMVFDDVRAPPQDQVEFVLHLGDFLYDTVWRATEHPKGYFDRTIRDVELPHGEAVEDIHIPTGLDDYRALYRAYLRDPDLQAARARWPFVAIWDNGEYSDAGWQGLQRFGGRNRPAQTRKVAANQAWFEYLPSRARNPGGSLDAFKAPKVSDVPVTVFDGDGLGQEPNNLAALASLTGYRALRWGPHVELILTDQRSYRSEDYTAGGAGKLISSNRFPQMVPFESLQMIDAGAGWAQGHPPERLVFGDRTVPNFRRGASPRTLLGARQKAWFLDRLARSTATWKLWGDTVATLDMRADPQHLPPGLAPPWPGQGYAGYARTDHSTTYAERGQIYDFVAERGITGFVTLSGDRHSFWAGLAAKSLPPERFQPVGAAFVTGSISSPGMVEALEYILPKDHPLRPLYLVDRPGRAKPEATVNLLLKHGVRTCLDYAAHGDLAAAKALADPGNAPHVDFVDMGGHGYGLVRAAADRLEVEFVAVPRPVSATSAPDGGPVRYRVTHRVRRWAAGEAPRVERAALEGDAELSA